MGDGAWHHLVFTRTSATGASAIYLDGSLAWTGVIAAGIAPSSGGGAVVLGQDQDSVLGTFEASQAYAGSLDEVAVFGRMLDAAEVQTLYRGQICE